mmetsp:Transcript_9274/g.22800  ORF Transcript_9274/g.22800 Transcript_9274/m.22800 type:complete len:117 (-) Transcript_9274:49-399(-)
MVQCGSLPQLLWRLQSGFLTETCFVVRYDLNASEILVLPHLSKVFGPFAQDGITVDCVGRLHVIIAPDQGKRLHGLKDKLFVSVILVLRPNRAYKSPHLVDLLTVMNCGCNIGNNI